MAKKHKAIYKNEKEKNHINIYHIGIVKVIIIIIVTYFFLSFRLLS